MLLISEAEQLVFVQSYGGGVYGGPTQKQVPPPADTGPGNWPVLRRMRLISEAKKLFFFNPMGGVLRPDSKTSPFPG